MSPVFNTICSVLEEAHLLTHEAAEKLATDMQTSIHQASYGDALHMVKEVARDVGQFTDEPWAQRIEYLEARVKELEAKFENRSPKK